MWLVEIVAANDPIPAHYFPLVAGQPDESAGYAAYKCYNALIDHRAAQYGDRPFLVEAGFTSTGACERTYTFREARRVVLALAKQYAVRFPPRKKGEEEKVVGFLAKGGVDFALNDFALMRLGWTPFYIQTTCSPSAIASMLRTGGAEALIFSPDLRELAEASISELSLSYDVGIEARKWLDVPAPSQIPDVDDPVETELSYDEPHVSIAGILHSSGSTGHPKPIPSTHRAAINQVQRAFLDDVLITTPLAHIFARFALLNALAAASRAIILRPTVQPTGAVFMRVLAAHPKVRVYTVPAIIVMIASELGGIDTLAQLPGLGFSGGPLPPDIGHRLVEVGTQLYSIIGSTEAGRLMISKLPSDLDWEWLDVESLVDPWYVEFEPYDGDLYHMIVRPGYPSLSKANRPDGSYESGDLLIPRLSRAGLWKYIGRVDDMIVHSTGLKTNPVPMEKQLEAGGLIKEAMVVGNNKQCAGLLVILSKDSPGDRALQKVLALLDQVNTCAPSQSRIVPELVKILPPGSAFGHTVKRTLRRRLTVDKYAGEVEAMYCQYDGSAVGAQTVLQLRQEAVDIIEDVLDEVFPRVQGQQMDTDFFDLGMNSLNATRIRNALQRRLACRPPLKATVVFEHPSKDLLASFLWNSVPEVDDQQTTTRLTWCCICSSRQKAAFRGTKKTRQLPTETPSC